MTWSGYGRCSTTRLLIDGALGSTRGLEQTIAGLGHMFTMTEQVDVLHRWVDVPNVLSWFELSTETTGPLQS